MCLLCIAALCVTPTVYHPWCPTAGGPFFDPLGFSRGDEQSYFEYKTKEVKNGRLAMLAFLGFFAQYAATGMHCRHCIICLLQHQLQLGFDCKLPSGCQLMHRSLCSQNICVDCTLLYRVSDNSPTSLHLVLSDGNRQSSIRAWLRCISKAYQAFCQWECCWCRL